MELPAHNNEWSSRYATGISYHSEYLSRVKDWLDFFDFLSKNADLNIGGGNYVNC